ncbi:NAD(P)H-quinone oxidoreductase [Salinisphaera orenii]|uniref:NAD(P)H-quinone oxidoreductase n=1 Tax=Salinisphaera orenii TaxID=856731 RepID=UPI001C8433DE|nr:NAD(P)H-quinone oxidoreductase [Salinisphaera orenii]
MNAAALPETMTVVTAPEPGGPAALRTESRPVPGPAGRELLVRVAAAGVNRPDVMQRMGNYPPPPGANDVLGLEIAGEVVAVADGVERFAVGDRVMALVASGGYSEYAVVDDRNALSVPDGFSMVEAAAVPETFFTVWTNVFERGGLKAGETLLVHGGSSGIGTTAIQLAVARGATVYVTAGSEDKCERCRALGAEVALNYRAVDFVSEIHDRTNGRGVDVVLDMVAGDYVDRNLQVAAVDGRVVQIALMQGPQATIDLRHLMPKRVTFTGSTLRARSVEAKAEIAAALADFATPLWAEGRCRPVIDSTYALADVVAAHERMDAPHIGKVVLETPAAG